MTTKVTLTKSVAFAIQVVDDKGKPVKVTVPHKGRTQEIVAHDNVYHEAGAVISVDDALAAELLKHGAARPFDPAIDEEAAANQASDDDALA